MPARIEALHVPNTFDRLAQGSAVRGANIEAFRPQSPTVDTLAQDGLTIFPSFQEPASPSIFSQVAGKLLPIEVALVLVSAACASQVAQGNDQSHEVYIPGVGKSDPALVDARIDMTQTAVAATQTAAAEKTPTAVARTPEPTRTGTPEKPKPSEKTAPKEETVKKIKKLIEDVQNPNPELVTKYGISDDRLKSNEQQILNGAPDRKIPGLADVQKSIEQGDMTVAHDQLIVVFTTFLWNGAIPSENGGSDRVILTEEEKKQLDPENRYFSLKRIPPVFSGVRKGVAANTLGMLYEISPQGSIQAQKSN